MKAALSVALALLVAACSDTTGMARGVRVNTDASFYPLPSAQPPMVPVRFTVKNTGSTSLSLPNCGAGVTGELQQQQPLGEWVTVQSGICQTFAVYVALVVVPGESAEGQTTVSAPGRYRVRIAIIGAGDEEPTRYAISPTFRAAFLEN
ncbi:MAG TPA: hypothetical protein VJT67_11220 [Longimicrobiaceae bacterium]|nr:hypothetical protein [Longimicrobiaceae bacterium]